MSEIAGAYNHSVALKTDGSLWTWGSNGWGELGDGNRPNHRFFPMPIGAGYDWHVIDARSSHTLAIKTDGTLWGWGHNQYGQIGDLHLLSGVVSSPVQIGSGNNWLTVAGGHLHSVALKNDGTIWTWGHNNAGQLGDGTTDDRHFPEQVNLDTDWIAIFSGGNFVIAMKENGEL